MKQNNQSLDDFLRSSVEEAEFSYKEDYWVQMSAILDDEEKKKKGFPFWRGLSMLLVLLAIGVGVYLFPKLKQKSSSKTESAITAQSVAGQQQTLPPSVNQDQPVSNEANKGDHETTTSATNPTAPVSGTNSTGNSSADATTSPASNANTSPTTQSTINTAQTAVNADPSGSGTNPTQWTKNQQTGKGKTSVKNHTSNGNSDNLSQNPTTTTSANSNASPRAVNKNTRKDDIHTDDQTSNTANSPDVVALPNKTKKVKKGRQRTEVTSNQNQTPKGSKKEDAAQSASPDNPSAPVVINTSSSPADRVRNGMHPVDTSVYQGTPKRDHTLDNPRYVASLSDYIPTRVDSITVITFQPDPAVVAVQPKEAVKATATPAAYSRGISFMLNAGLNANKGFKGNVENPISWGYAPYLGAGIEKPISSKLTLSSHVGFTYFNGLNSELKINSYNYGFGLDSSNISILSKKMLQLYLPVSVYYEVIKNHYLMAAIGAMYSLDVSSKVTQRSLSNNTGTPAVNSKMATTSTSTESGYRSGFNQFDVFAQIGYSYKVNQSVMLQFTFQQGFFDMTKNSYFNNTLNNTQTRLSLGLKYNFKRN